MLTATVESINAPYTCTFVLLDTALPARFNFKGGLIYKSIHCFKPCQLPRYNIHALCVSVAQPGSSAFRPVLISSVVWWTYYWLCCTESGEGSSSRYNKYRNLPPLSLRSFSLLYVISSSSFNGTPHTIGSLKSAVWRLQPTQVHRYHADQSSRPVAFLLYSDIWWLVY